MTLAPGRDLDAEIAKRIFKYTVKPYNQVGRPDWHYETPDGVILVPSYSTHIAAAWLVAEKTHLFSIYSLSGENGQWTLFEVLLGEDGVGDLYHEKREFVRAKTAPHAICLAALALSSPHDS